ncbi:MAG TPA: aryl-sulfate sulfotransferase [Candidatus Sulfotelmatobacter sp.]|nr:aryl-sulfate sulfotransferase [Candidatus Sulfotelmatobacter sp.]
MFLAIVASVGCGSNNVAADPITSVNPTANPLVAQYGISHYDSGLTAWVEFGTDTSYGRQTSDMSSGKTVGRKVVNILVAGMKAQTTYHMRAHVTWSGGSWVDQDQAFTTGALPSLPSSYPAGSVEFPAISVQTPTPGLSPSPGVELLSLTSAAQSLAVDLQGNIIWFCQGNAEPIKPMQNGHFIIVRGTDIQEVDLACNVVRNVTYPQINQSLQANGYDFQIPAPLGLNGGNPFHHDVLVLPNGHWIALSQIAKSFTDLPGYPGTTQVAGDALVDIDPSGTVAWAWSSFDHLDVNRHPYFGLPDWTHSNALVYTPEGNLLLSMRNQSWVLKIDYANGTGSGNILWKVGEDGDFTLFGEDPSQWFYAQHYPNILSADGSQTMLAVYDDGNARVAADGSSCPPAPPAPTCYSRATIFQIDESTNFATLEWQYLPGFFSFWGGSVNLLDNNDIEFDSSSPSNYVGSTIMEVTQTGSPQIVWQMNIAGAGGVGAYRGYRIPSLYPGVTWKQ